MGMNTASIQSDVEKITDQVVSWRRHLHQNPEVSFTEVKTSQFVYDTLQSFGGLELSRPTQTSVVARLVGSKPGPVLAIRADMDALPIQEENAFDFVSQVPGAMHACGHDGHTAMLLGTAKILVQHKDQLSGEVRFIFQHAEELPPGGAREIVNAGVLDDVSAIIGIHLWSPLQVGQIQVLAGPFMAAGDVFEITIMGKGGHAAQPNLTVDSVAVAAQVVTNLQHIVSRVVDPLEPSVVSVTRIVGGTANNIIPSSVQLGGTVRCFNPALRDTIPEKMEQVIRGITQAHGATYEFNFTKGYAPVSNDPAVTQRIRSALVNAFGEQTVVEGVPTMGGEDFSGYQQIIPGTFFFVGAGNTEKGITYPHHHPRFTVDEDALPIGIESFLNIVFDMLGESGTEPNQGVGR